MCSVPTFPRKVAYLEVVVPPEISDKRSTKDISVHEGGNANFLCAATGHPLPSITWRRVPRDGAEKLKIRFKDGFGKMRTGAFAVVDAVGIETSKLGGRDCISEGFMNCRRDLRGQQLGPDVGQPGGYGAVHVHRQEQRATSHEQDVQAGSDV